jgi:hypothetical protein
MENPIPVTDPEDKDFRLTLEASGRPQAETEMILALRKRAFGGENV